MLLCPVCGNENEVEEPVCRFCGNAVRPPAPEGRSAPILHRRVNLKQGRPVVEVAVQRMKQELAVAAALNTMVLSLIHGYGSSGTGGAIREACRRLLADLVHERQLQEIIPGELFHRRTGPGKALLRRYPQLAQTCRGDFNNPGVTIVVR